MHKDILITSIVYFNQELVKTHVDFLTSVSDKADVIVLENPSDSTSEISKYCIDLVQQNKLYKYLLFDQNIGMNTFETLFNSSVINIDDYSYIIITDGDLVVKNNNWLDEQTHILDKYPDTYACGVKMSMENLPSIKIHPNVNKWYPRSSKIGTDYEDGETGLHLLMYKNDVLKQFLDFIRSNCLTLMDTTMHGFCNGYLHKQWKRTKKSECHHLTWDLYNDVNDKYLKIKTTQSREDLWYHGKYCNYIVYEYNELDFLPNIKRYEKYVKPEKFIKSYVSKKFIKESNTKVIKKYKTKTKTNDYDIKRKIRERKENEFLKQNFNALRRPRISYSRKIVGGRNIEKEIIGKRQILQPIQKINIGCGSIGFDNDWINVDQMNRPIFFDNIIKYQQLDILKNFPFQNVQLIYCEHFIEHLNKSEGINFIRHCFNALGKGGILRISTFDLDELIDNCHSTNPDWKKSCEADRLELGHLSKCEYLNMAFNGWDHKHIYNHDELIDVFRKGGFINFKKCEINISDNSELCNRESRFNSRLIIEGKK
jgi:predicted SAM-dependent methyltransferase